MAEIQTAMFNYKYVNVNGLFYLFDIAYPLESHHHYGIKVVNILQIFRDNDRFDKIIY